MTDRRPGDTEFAPFYAAYIARVPEIDPRPVLERQPTDLRRIAASVNADRETFRYAPDKWSIRQTFGHLIDTERVMGYRAFCIGRGETKALPGFDQEEYIAHSHFDAQPLAGLAEEFAAARASHLWAIRQWTPEDWDRVGNANGKPVTARAIAFIMAGHVRHHLAILGERYGVAV